MSKNTQSGDALSGAAQSLAAFVEGPVTSAAQSIDTVVSRAFGAVERSIASAAVSGKLSMKAMVDAIVADLDRIAIRQYVVKPTENLISSLIDAILPIAGARASGGPVAAGSAYLVGEQGPELFVPSASGTVASNASLSETRSRVVVNVQATDARSFLKSESQVSAMMLRAMRRGQRNL
jgi:phage-related minor tail protein